MKKKPAASGGVTLSSVTPSNITLSSVTLSSVTVPAEKKYFEIAFDIPLDRTFTYLQDTKNEAAPGKRVMAPFGKREIQGFVIQARDAPPENIVPASIKTIRRVIDGEAVFDDDITALARWIADFYLCGIGEALAAMIPSGRRAAAAPGFSLEDEAPSPAALDLSAEQRAALDAVSSALDGSGVGGRGIEQKKRPWFYLYGITGSGKTEVFLRAAEKYLDAGKSVLYLVPEISLTHQCAEIIEERFGKRAVAIHSGMSGPERLARWKRIMRGEANIVVGPRSAVFAPLRNPGLIIIDEEQDGSYKSGNTPRYHARQIAMRRAAVSGAVLVMGSATPSLEAWKLINSGGMKRLDLSRRLAGGKPPEIKNVDLRGSEDCLSPELKDEIKKTAQAGKQTILFLNRRGFAHFYQCGQCGFVLECKNCSVSLTWHKSKGKAVCHYCGYSETPPSVCPSCGSLAAGFRGFGTEMIEEEVNRAFPSLKIARADTDSVTKKGSLEKILADFRAGKTDILLGTQMVAKGLNFPGLRLVGVVMADTGLSLPDFRAAERTFQLIVQVAGRAGRYFPDGKVIVQTFRPRDRAIVRAAALELEPFYAEELAERKALGFPPFTRIIRFVLRAKDEKKADAAAARLAGLAEGFLPRGAELLGPAECPLSLVAGNFRRQVMIRGPSMGNLHSAARSVIREYAKAKEGRTFLEVDVDPVSML